MPLKRCWPQFILMARTASAREILVRYALPEDDELETGWLAPGHRMTSAPNSTAWPAKRTFPAPFTRSSVNRVPAMRGRSPWK